MTSVAVARRYFNGPAVDATGRFAGLRDRFFGKTLGLMHERTAHAWSVDDFTHKVGLARPVPHEWFLQFLGLRPVVRGCRSGSPGSAENAGIYGSILKVWRRIA
jgi:hypothetical protein